MSATAGRSRCNDGDAFGLGDDRDPLVGASGGSGKMTINGAPPRFVSPPADVVTVRGGEYLFVPGISALRTLTGPGVGETVAGRG